MRQSQHSANRFPTAVTDPSAALAWLVCADSSSSEGPGEAYWLCESYCYFFTDTRSVLLKDYKVLHCPIVVKQGMEEALPRVGRGTETD